MATGYSLSDNLPKDAGGLKFSALVNPSALDFVLQKAVGASIVSNKIIGHAAIGTHNQASKIESLHPFVAIGGVYTEGLTASPVAPGQGKIAHISNEGEIYATGAPKLYSMTTASQQQIKSSSGVVYGYVVATSGVNANDTIDIEDGSSTVFGYNLDAGNNRFSVSLPQGGIQFQTSINVAQSITGGAAAASVTVIYR